jgi:hypothetical protein
MGQKAPFSSSASEAQAKGADLAHDRVAFKHAPQKLGVVKHALKHRVVQHHLLHLLHLLHAPSASAKWQRHALCEAQQPSETNPLTTAQQLHSPFDCSRPGLSGHTQQRRGSNPLLLRKGRQVQHCQALLSKMALCHLHLQQQGADCADTNIQA